MKPDALDSVARSAVRTRFRKGLTVRAGPVAGAAGAACTRPGQALLILPDGPGAYAETVRAHEAGHLNIPERRRKISDAERILPVIGQTIADVRVHTGMARALEQMTDPQIQRTVARSHVSAALYDVRQTCKALAECADLSKMPDEVWNQSMNILTRSATILTLESPYATRVPVWRRGSKSPYNRFRRRARGSGVPAYEIRDAIVLIRQRKYVDGSAALAKLFRFPRGPCDRYDPKADAGSGTVRATDPMTVEDLPRTVPCVARSARTYRPSASGMRMRPSRLAGAVARGSAQGLFRRKIRHKTGSYLFDASGSMRLSGVALARLCAAAPGAVVAYYEGNDNSGRGPYGKLRVYARDGMRFAGTRVPLQWGGNAVDLWAIEWLLRQPAPRIIVTDGGFCGGPDNQEERAMTLLLEAVADGRIRWLETVEDAERLLGVQNARS